jgi:hypothetical protein
MVKKMPSIINVFLVALSVINWFSSLTQEQQLKVIKILLLLFKYGFHWYKSKHCKVKKDSKGHVNNKKRATVCESSVALRYYCTHCTNYFLNKGTYGVQQLK